MKIRTDFVTNSSSSSFCSINVTGEKLKEILQKYKDVFDNSDLYGITITENGFEYESDGWDPEGPKNENEIARSLIDFIDELCVDYGEKEKFGEVLSELENNVDSINDTITSLNWEYRNVGYGADDESRLNIKRYEEDYIVEYLSLKKGTELTPEIKERFLEKVADKTSLERKQWEYDGKKLTISSEFEIID